MTTDYCNIVSHLDYFDKIKEYLLLFDFSSIADLDNKVKNAYCSELESYPIVSYSAAERLVVLNLLFVALYEKYKSFGVKETIIWDTFQDAALRANLYYKSCGEVGISDDDAIWFRHIIHMELFKLGAIQFQPFQMIYLDEETIGEDYMTFSKEQKENLPAGTPVINCHIQKGQPFSRDLIERSFRLADSFFRTHYPNTAFQAYLCYSWLLYPPMTEMMDEHSNIRHFAEQFTIIGQCPDAEQAEENLVKNTRLFAMYEQQKERFGYACGIRKFSLKNNM